MLARALLAAVVLVAAPAWGAAQETLPQGATRHMSVSWAGVPVRDVLRAFAAYSGMSIVAGSGVTGVITADINDQPWDVALGAILSVNGLVATEDEHGIIRVDDVESLHAREALEPVVTRAYRISYSRAEEIRSTIAPLLSERGSVSVTESTNTLIVSDIARVQQSVARLLR